MVLAKNIREPKQKRSIQTKERILSATQQLICEKGYFSITTNQIAKSANLSIGSLYSYFSDKDTILMELLDIYNQNFIRFFKNIKTVALTELYKTNTHVWLEFLVKNLIELHESQKDFAKELNVLYYAKPKVSATIDAQAEKIRNFIYVILLQNSKTDNTEDLQAASIIIYDFLSTLIERVVFKDDTIDKQSVIDVGINMLNMYLNTITDI